MFERKTTINIQKTEYMMIKKKPKLNKNILRQQNSVKYLDATIGNKLDFKEHINRILSAATYKLFLSANLATLSGVTLAKCLKLCIMV